MKILDFFLVTLFLVSSESVFFCEIKDMKDNGFGCKITNVTINNQPVKIEMSQFSRQLTPANLNWIKIVDSKFLRSPKPLFALFKNAKRVIINNVSGWKTFEASVFNKNTEKIAIKDTKLENINEKLFSGLSQLTRLDLTGNGIKTIHKNALVDLTALTRIDLSFNNIESLDSETFENNINLKNISLGQNEIKSLNVDLFARNLELQRLDLSDNKVSQIEEGFVSNLAELLSLDLSSNVCVDKRLIEDDVFDLKSFLGQCFINYSNNPPSDV